MINLRNLHIIPRNIIEQLHRAITSDEYIKTIIDILLSLDIQISEETHIDNIIELIKGNFISIKDVIDLSGNNLFKDINNNNLIDETGVKEIIRNLLYYDFDIEKIFAHLLNGAAEEPIEEAEKPTGPAEGPTEEAKKPTKEAEKPAKRIWRRFC